MEDTKIQWHPGFVAAMNLEFLQNKDDLVFVKEHNLNTKPLEIDLLVIKKGSSAKISNEIGRIFRVYNIFEYKSPGDHLDADVFFKVLGYACLYKSYGEVLDLRKAEEITVSFVRDSKPLGLFRYLEEHGYAVTCHSHGIYYVEGNVPFLVQIVVTKELDKHAHAWLRALSSNLQKEDALRVLYKIPGLDGAFEREMADSVLAVMAKANSSLVDGLRGGNGMYYETLFKILEPDLPRFMEKSIENGDSGIYESLFRALEPNLPMLMEKSIENGENDVYEALFTALEPKFPMLLETVRNEDIQRTISVLRDFGHYDKDIRAAIMDKYSLTPAKADELLNTPPASSK